MGGGPHAPGSPIGTAAVLLDSNNNTYRAPSAFNSGTEDLIPLVEQTCISEEPRELMTNSAEADLSEGDSMKGQINESSQIYQLHVPDNVGADSSEGKSTEGQTGESSQANLPHIPNDSPGMYHHDSIRNPIIDANPHGGPGVSVPYCHTCGAGPGSQVLEGQGPSETPFQKHFARYSASYLADTSNPSTDYGTFTNYSQLPTPMRVPRPPISLTPMQSQTARYNALNFGSEMASELEQMRITRESFDPPSDRPTLQQQPQTRTGRPMQSGTDEMAWRRQQIMAVREQQPRRNQQAYPYRQPQDMARAPQHIRQRPVDFATDTRTHSPPKPRISSHSRSPSDINAQPAILARQTQPRQAQIQQQEQLQQTRTQQHQQASLNQQLHTQHSTNTLPYPPHPLAPTSMNITPNRRPQLPIPVRYARGWNRHPNTTFQPLRWTAPPSCYPSTNSNAPFSPFLSPREMARFRAMQMKG